MKNYYRSGWNDAISTVGDYDGSYQKTLEAIDDAAEANLIFSKLLGEEVEYDNYSWICFGCLSTNI